MKYLLLLSILFALVVIPCLAQNKGAAKIDDVADAQCDDYLSRTIFYVNTLKKTPNSKGVVIIYEGKVAKGLYDKNPASYDYDKIDFPRFGLANELIKTMKPRFALLGVNKKEIAFIKGGFRENLSIELWIVANDVATPQLTPTLNKMRYRKGKPRGYCLTI